MTVSHTPVITHPDQFQNRHIGLHANQTQTMLDVVGEATLEEFISKVVPPDIRLPRKLNLPAAATEQEALLELRAIAAKNKPFRSYIGMGYSDSILPGVILRNILENPGWYTQYTPYQAEISQGRLEALLNFQTMVCDLTGMAIANASMLDEATAAAEAMHLALATQPDDHASAFYVSKNCHPQTIAVVRTRAEALGIKVIVVDEKDFQFTKKPFAILLQYPGTDGTVLDLEPIIRKAHEAGALAIVAADILALTLLRPPGEAGADVVIGNTQRFGMPYGLGGPHAAYFATKDELKRTMPGRLIGVSKDTSGNPALRLSLQTREQHIRREKATSNICTAQVLPAIVASMYAVYHGPENLRKIAQRVHTLALYLREGFKQLGHGISETPIFDTVRVTPNGTPARKILALAKKRKINLRLLDSGTLVIALDEVTSKEDVATLLSIFTPAEKTTPSIESLTIQAELGTLARTSKFLQHVIFNSHHSETEMMRYLRKLESRDLSLNYSMIPLGSCTMKLNAVAEMAGITWPEFTNVHPYAPLDQHQGYKRIIDDLENWLAEITGFKAVSLQPNAGSAGEYAGLLTIRKYHQSRNESHRNICLIPSSAHGTNPASAAMAGMQVVVVKCDSLGNIDLADLEEKARAHTANLAAIMVTYPSTHGVFETGIRRLCEIVHANGGQVYMDGANMNAQVGLCRPGDIGADVCHLNLHKTFSIPHGGGGPGMGPIGVAEHLTAFLPSHPLTKAKKNIAGPVSAAPYGSGLILIIPWMYIRMMGPQGLADASRYSILSANYIARRVEKYYPILFKGEKGYVAHECILDCHDFKTAGIEVEDIAKRLIDYGFHAPTMSWPVHNTLMVEPTESEPLVELDRFCDAMISIRREIDAVAAGSSDKKNNALKNAPHTASVVTSDQWDRPYSREQAAFPTPFVRDNKFWPYVGRVDNVYGDRNLFCSCPPISNS